MRKVKVRMCDVMNLSNSNGQGGRGGKNPITGCIKSIKAKYDFSDEDVLKIIEGEFVITKIGDGELSWGQR